MFNSITTWIIDHKDDIITAVIIESILSALIMSFRYVIKNIPKAIKRLSSITAIKYLGFILLYAFPLGTIIWIIVDKTNEPTFKNITLFIIICVTLVFNILMSHINSIYDMIYELTSKTSDNDLVHKKAINTIFEKIGSKERINKNN